MPYLSIVIWLRWLARSAPKNGCPRRIGCPRYRQNLHDIGAKKRFGNQNRQKLVRSNDFLKSQAANFAPGCGERVVWKINSIINNMMGTPLEN